ncbi:MAG: ACP S-malonyltransferase [Vampirovibrionia bacterium]
MSNIALIFPGQGSQVVGMGKDLYENSDIAKDLFDKIDGILGKKLSTLCFEGPEEELKQTINTQPAIVAVSIIAYETLKAKYDINFKYTAGHSLGEYSALYASGVLDLESTINLVKRRSECMDAAPSGAMTAIVGLEQTKLEDIISEVSKEGIVAIANYNTPEQLVITGDPEMVTKAGEMAKEAGAKRVIPLPVSGAFHSPLMQQPADEFASSISLYNFNNASVPVVTNIDALSTTEGFDQKLVKQIYSSVMWTQSVELMKQNGVDTFIEVGPGKVLSGMVKKIDRKLNVLNVADMASLEATLNNLSSALSV